MSLYNMLFGRTPNAAIFLTLLDLKTEDCGRFRDCYPSDDGTRIYIYTRNGGGNRESYMPDFSKHPQFLEDNDDEFDSTYATLTFETPKEAVELVKELADKTNTTPPAERWAKLLKDMEDKKSNAAVARAMEVGAKIFEVITGDGPGGPVATPDGSVTVTKVETRAQHLEWCKKRALEELNRRGDVRDACRNAFASMGSDLGKHPETEGHIAIQLGMSLMMADQREAHDREAMRKFINGFN
jgi:hypothetical protein